MLRVGGKIVVHAVYFKQEPTLLAGIPDNYLAQCKDLFPALNVARRVEIVIRDYLVGESVDSMRNNVSFESSVPLNVVPTYKTHTSQSVRGLQESLHAETIRRLHGVKLKQGSLVLQLVILVCSLGRNVSLSSRQGKLKALSDGVNFFAEVLQLSTEILVEFEYRFPR